MCGIAGFIGQGSRQLLEKMVEDLRHRGPDEDGFLIDEAKRVFLGMRRLAIIDVAGGGQPIFNFDKSIGVVYNGEIYNYQALKKELEERGCRFQTKSDTETIVHGYQEYGPGIFSRLNGMFAIALWDSRRQRLVLARDRVGEKPLYWLRTGNALFFASELKVFSETINFDKAINPGAFVRFMDQSYIGSQETIYKNVFKLGPGEFLVFENSQVKIEKYWQLPLPGAGLRQASSVAFQQNFPALDEAAGQLDALISDAVKIRLMSEVPLGVFLSGGLDSSLVAYYAQKNSSQKIKTFHIRFEQASFDESEYARSVARHLGTEHTEECVSAGQTLSIIEKLPEIMDEPLADSSIIPTYWLSKLTRQHVTVALGGDAGDELFFGYHTFHAWKYWQWLRLLPAAAMKLLQRTAAALPSRADYFSLDFKLKRGLLNFDSNPYSQHFRWYSAFSRDELKRLFNAEFIKPEDLMEYFSYRDSWPIDKPADEIEEKEMSAREAVVTIGDTRSIMELSASLYQKYYLTDDIFTKVDRASMAVSLETRAPLVDYRLIEFVNALPAAFKYYQGETKYILKKLAARVLPAEIISRFQGGRSRSIRDLTSPTKRGFSGPVDDWLRRPLNDRASELFSQKSIGRLGLLDFEYVDYLWQDFLQGNHYRARQIWTIFVWQSWSDKYLI